MCFVLCAHNFQAHMTLGCPNKHVFWPCRLASKCKVTYRARNTLSKDGGSPLNFGPPGPQRSATTLIRPKIQNCRTKVIVCSFESSWRGKQIWGIHNILLPKFRWKIQTKTKRPLLSSSFPWIFSKVLDIEHFASLIVCLSRQDLSNEYMINSVLAGLCIPNNIFWGGHPDIGIAYGALKHKIARFFFKIIITWGVF